MIKPINHELRTLELPSPWHFAYNQKAESNEAYIIVLKTRSFSREWMSPSPNVALNIFRQQLITLHSHPNGILTVYYRQEFNPFAERIIKQVKSLCHT